MIGAGNPPPTFIARQINSLQALGVEIKHFPKFIKHTYTFTRLCQLGFSFHLPRQTKNLIRQADILHFQWPGHLINFGSLAKRYKKKIVLSLRGRQINILPYLPGQEKYVKNIKRILPQCDAYHCVSAEILTRARNFGVVSERAQVIYTAVDTDIFKPPQVLPTAPPTRILMIGSIIWRKGYEYALVAFRHAIESGANATLTIVGSGEETDRLNFTISDLNLSDRVTHISHLNSKQVRDLINNSHIFLHTALSEGIANSVIEAMACGLPIVTTDVGGMSEAVNNHVEGFLIPPRDPEATANALLKLINSLDLRKQMGEAGRLRCLRQFNYDRYGSQFVDLYNKVLSS
ncbi:glycosyltransferase family 4 protein [Chloroflexota bacterium]